MKSVLFILVFDYAIVTLIDQSDDVVEFDEFISEPVKTANLPHGVSHL